jgi:hypothetical protein
MSPSDAEALARPLNPIYAGVTHGSSYNESAKHYENAARYNRDTAKIIDKCWNCSRFGMGGSDQERKEQTRCQRCRAAMLKAIELAEADKK